MVVDAEREQLHGRPGEFTPNYTAGQLIRGASFFSVKVTRNFKGIERMGWVGMLFVGAVMGWAAWSLNPTQAHLRLWSLVRLGALGAMMAGFASQLLGIYREGSMRGMGVVFLGALMMIGVYMAYAARFKSRR